MCRRAIRPVGLDRVPELLQALLVGVAVLHDQRRDPLRMLQRQPIAHGRAIVHDVEREARDLELRAVRRSDRRSGEGVANPARSGMALWPKPG